MIGWQLPAALWGLAAAAIPIVIHLLRMHRAARIEFPSVRFVRAAQTAAVRIQPPSDWWLMLLRVGAVAAAVVALAGPVLMTQSRHASWDATVARAVVVDTSDSMRAGRDTALASLVTSAAEAEAQTATYSRRFDATTLGAGLASASAWLAGVPPSRREVVVLSDFQQGALAAADIAAVPTTVGVRLVPMGPARAPGPVAGPDLLAPDGGAWAQTMRLTPDATAVSVERVERRAGSGIRFVDADARRADTDALVRAVAAAGAPAGSAEMPIALRFVDAPAPAPSTPVSPVPSGWMTSAVLRMRGDASLVAVSRSGMADRTLESMLSIGADGWAVVARDAGDRPVVAAAAAGPELQLAVAASPRSLLAAATLRAALSAMRPSDSLAEHEIAAIDAGTLAGWNRPPAPLDRARSLDPDRLRAIDRTDARWCWALALTLLLIEQWARARRVKASGVEASRVAA